MPKRPEIAQVEVMQQLALLLKGGIHGHNVKGRAPRNCGANVVHQLGLRFISKRRVVRPNRFRFTKATNIARPRIIITMGIDTH